MLPLFEITINEDIESKLEVNYIALVDKPAIEKDFLKFSNDKKVELKFSSINDERRILSGPAMLANVPIYRRDEDGKEYNVFFSAETIYKIVLKIFEKKYVNNFNIMHDPNLKLDDVVMFESFIVDSARGIKPMDGYEDAEDGSWFISVKVKNDAVWEAAKSRKIKGFSVEGCFNVSEESSPYVQLWKQISEILNEIKTN